MKNDIIIASGGLDFESKGMGLNYSYMWKIIENLSDIVHQYPPIMIPKGRSFGSWGCEERAAQLIYKEMEDNLSINPKREKLEPIDDTFTSALRYYTSFANVEDYKLTIEHPDYGAENDQTEGFPQDVPLSECFPDPSGVKHIPVFGSLTHNYTMNDSDNVRVISQFESGWPRTGTFTDEYKNVTSLELNGINFICGNVTFINNSSDLPIDQIGRVFLINETEGCETILNNITNASGAILCYSGRVILPTMLRSIPLLFKE